SFICVDGRNASQAEELIRQANFIILGGGHTPSQNCFFKDMGLADLLKAYDGVIWAISAGSMNCAETVYAAPEEDGEALDPDYKRFLTGLGFTKTTILPHYNYWKDKTLDGLNYINEIILPDSIGRTFYYIADGSYILVKDGMEELRGEAYIVRNGTIKQISANGDTVLL
ncbi:MAG: Type 1 glutamine amidotransferase-like domain-containing protein, partial [Clostridia bacterium]|nr:Type 1 glutamine amidotransferase-like domain-containing protein [Clostridia bacterium]